MTNYLALDLGTKTGVAFNHGRSFGVQHWDFTPCRGAPCHYGHRFSKFVECLAAHHKILPVHHVLFEQVCAHKGTKAAQIYGGFLAVLAAWSHNLGIQMTPVGVGTIKRRIAGRGNASKQEVMDACKARGHAPKTFDEADALALLLGVLDFESARVVNIGS